MNSDLTKIESKYRVIGVMSGTSLDALDLALVEFEKVVSTWHYQVIQTKEIPYPSDFRQKLSRSTAFEAADLIALDFELGQFIGEAIRDYFSSFEIDFIASHGHTIYHQPNKNISLQIGAPSKIYETTGCPVISDFRSADVQKGGQGAPLVPIGDQLLFANYECCLNLGGIANCSFQLKGERIAYDLMPFNMALNKLAQRLNQPYDVDGNLARSGKLIPSLLADLSTIKYYQVKAPKSLGYEDFSEFWEPLISNEVYQTKDLLHTYVQHAAKTIADELNAHLKETSKLLVTGGGAFHSFFIELLEKNFLGKLIVPSAEVINFKEAIIFAFLGVLRTRNEPNCLASVTGALKNSSSGKLTGFQEKNIQ